MLLLVCLVGMMLPVGLSAMICVLLLVRESAIHGVLDSGAEAPCMPGECTSSSNVVAVFLVRGISAV